jgi:hypothetical protein
MGTGTYQKGGIGENLGGLGHGDEGEEPELPRHPRGQQLRQPTLEFKKNLSDTTVSLARIKLKG